MNKTVSWTRPKMERFKIVYAKAVSDKVTSFEFEGETYLAAYAKYVLEYLEGKL